MVALRLAATLSSVLVTVSALAIPIGNRPTSSHAEAHAPNDASVGILVKKQARDLTYWLPAPSRVCAAGASEDDPNQTIFMAVDNDEMETAIWRRDEGGGEVHEDEVDDLWRWLVEFPDGYIHFLNQGDYGVRWRAPDGEIEIVVRADRQLPVHATRRVVGDWVNFLGHHRQPDDTAPAGTITLAGTEITITLRRIPEEERRPEAVIPAQERNDDVEGEVDDNFDEDIERILDGANSSHIPLIRYRQDYTFDQRGAWGGWPDYPKSQRKRKRTFGLLKHFWAQWNGHKSGSDHKDTEPNPCGCARKFMVVDLEAEVKRLKLDHLDLMTYASDDPREHEHLSSYLKKLQGIQTEASSEEKARAIASLLQLTDEPPEAFISGLQKEIDDCGCKGNDSETLKAKRKVPQGLAAERWEDDEWNHQLYKHDVEELLTDLKKNGLARVDPTWQSFRVRNAYVSWSTKFSKEGVAGPSREEILPYVWNFYNRVNWGDDEWWKYEPKHWSTSYRDVIFGQRTMRLCISNRPKRCLK